VTKNAPKGHLKHPSYIVGEDINSYDSFGLTEDPWKGKGHKNHKLSKNPDGSKNPSYLKKHMEVKNKKSYSKEPIKGWRMSDEDDDYINYLLLKRKK
jgi:hypothetical protein